ncbi:hypothetical protein BDR07DRAFT_1302180, partial [Suillus spraguei]
FSQSSTVKVAQGISGDVEDKGGVRASIPYLHVGVQHILQDTGVSDLQAAVKKGCARFEVRTPSAQVEECVHGLRL